MMSISFCFAELLSCTTETEIIYTADMNDLLRHVFIKYFKIGSTVELVIYIKKSN